MSDIDDLLLREYDEHPTLTESRALRRQFKKGNMTDPTQKLLLLAIKRSSPTTLGELVRSVTLVTDTTPAQVHDNLNTLLQGGFIHLSENGCYLYQMEAHHDRAA